MRKNKKIIGLVAFACLLLCGCRSNGQAMNNDKETTIPQNVALDDCEVLSWDEVEDASKYIVHINDDDYETETTQLDCFMLLDHYGNYEISVSSVSGHAESENSNILEYDLPIPEGLAYKTNSDNTEVTFGVSDASLVEGKVIVPSEVDGMPVTTILNDSFEGCTKMTGIILPDTITTIGYATFEGCTGLKRCKLPEFLGEIKSSMFKNCESLERIEPFYYVKSIASSAFYGCTSLKELVIPETLVWDRFSHPLDLWDCVSLEYIEFPSNYQGEFPRFGDKLPKIELNGNESIAYDGENNCYVSADGETLLLGDYNSTIPSYVSSIGEYAFYKRSIASIEIPSNVKKIGQCAFGGCLSLENVELCEGVEELGKECFRGCTALKSIFIPASLTSIHSYSLCACDPFYDTDPSEIAVAADNPVYCSDGNCLIEKETLSIIKGCSNSTIPEYAKGINASAFGGCTFSEIVLPSGLERIEKYAFDGCNNLREVRIPKTVKYIGYGAFSTCSLQLNIYLPKEVEYVDSHIGATSVDILQNTTIFIDAEEAPAGWHHDWSSLCKVCHSEFGYDGDVPYVKSVLIRNMGCIDVPYRNGYELIGFSFDEDGSEIAFKPKTIIGEQSGRTLQVIFTKDEALELSKAHKGERLYAIWKKI